MLERGRPYWAILLVLFVVLITVGSVVTVQHYEPTQGQAKQEAQNESKAKTLEILASERVAYYTKVLAIFTGLLSGFGLFQIIFLVRADNTARAAANASRDTVNTMDRTAERQLRAYVLPTAAHFERFAVGDVPVADVTIKNSGQTPAYDLTVWARVGTDVFPISKEATETWPVDHSDDLAPRVLGPGSEMHAVPRFGMPLNQETVDALRKGLMALYVQGEVTYRDAFNRPHTSRFFLFGGGSIGFNGNLASFRYGNTAD